MFTLISALRVLFAVTLLQIMMMITMVMLQYILYGDMHCRETDLLNIIL